MARGVILVAVGLMGVACGESAPSGPRVFFVQPEDGATVTSPVRLEKPWQGRHPAPGPD